MGVTRSSGCCSKSFWRNPTWTCVSDILALKDYMVFLAALNTFSTSRIATVASVHLTLVATTMFLVYAYRDLWPLATFTLRPLDESQGVLLWAKVALSAMAGLVIPLLEPYPYISARLEVDFSSDRSVQSDILMW